MDYLLFAIEETQEQSSLVFEHGLPTAIAITFLTSAAFAMFFGVWYYDTFRGSPTWTAPTLVRANFNIEEIEETEASRKSAYNWAIGIGVFLFIVSAAVLFYPVWFIANELIVLFSIFD